MNLQDSEHAFLVASHFPVLAWTVAHTKGPILELGSGLYSTPLIHALAGKDREILTLETNVQWLPSARKYETDKHHVKLVSSWDDLDEIKATRWGLAFIDQSPPPARARSILALRDCVDTFLVHDSEPRLRWYYEGTEEAFCSFAHVYDFTWFPKWTTMVSDRPEVVAAARAALGHLNADG